LPSRSLTNRGSDPVSLAQLAWKKCEDDGLIVARLGVLDNDLGKVWQPTQPHVAVRQLRDWFAQFPYLSKLREPQVLSKAISEAAGAFAWPSLEPVRIEEPHEQLEVGVTAVVRRRGHQ